MCIEIHSYYSISRTKPHLHPRVNSSTSACRSQQLGRIEKNGTVSVQRERGKIPFLDLAAERGNTQVGGREVLTYICLTETAAGGTWFGFRPSRFRVFLLLFWGLLSGG